MEEPVSRVPREIFMPSWAWNQQLDLDTWVEVRWIEARKRRQRMMYVWRRKPMRWTTQWYDIVNSRRPTAAGAPPPPEEAARGGEWYCATCQDVGCEECSGCDRCGGVVSEGRFLEDRGPNHPWCRCPGWLEAPPPEQPEPDGS